MEDVSPYASPKSKGAAHREGKNRQGREQHPLQAAAISWCATAAAILFMGIAISLSPGPAKAMIWEPAAWFVVLHFLASAGALLSGVVAIVQGLRRESVRTILYGLIPSLLNACWLLMQLQLAS